MKFINQVISKFKNAFNGLLYGIINDTSIKVQFFLMVVVITLGFYFKVSLTDWKIILLTVAIILGLEFVNSAIETLSDFASENQYSVFIKVVKDLSAGAVLIVSIFAFIIGILIFSQYI